MSTLHLETATVNHPPATTVCDHRKHLRLRRVLATIHDEADLDELLELAEALKDARRQAILDGEEVRRD
jgi:hypothetical protein